jgi:hypothetical protein
MISPEKSDYISEISAKVLCHSRHIFSFANVSFILTAFSDNRFANEGSRAIRIIASANAAAFSTGTNKPFSPSLMTALAPPP